MNVDIDCVRQQFQLSPDENKNFEFFLSFFVLKN